MIHIGQVNQVAYCSVKFAVRGLVQCAGKSWKGDVSLSCSFSLLYLCLAVPPLRYGI